MTQVFEQNEQKHHFPLPCHAGKTLTDYRYRSRPMCVMLLLLPKIKNKRVARIADINSYLMATH